MSENETPLPEDAELLSEDTPAGELPAEDVTEEEIDQVLATDDDGFITPPEPEADDATVVVQDFDPADPGAPLAEPQAVSTTEHRTARQVRKAEQRGTLDKSSLAEAPGADGEDAGE